MKSTEIGIQIIIANLEIARMTERDPTQDLLIQDPKAMEIEHQMEGIAMPREAEKTQSQIAVFLW
jgi:hypothetical protein